MKKDLNYLLRACALLLLGLAGMTPTWATTYTCSSVSQIQNALASVGPGDEIVITAGTYVETGVTVSGSSAYYYGSANGTASNPITIRSQSASNPATLSGDTESSLTVLRIVGDYWVVKDLKITKGQKGLIFDNANHCEARNVEVYQIGYEGIHVRDGSDYTLLEDCNVHDCGTVNAGFGEGIYIGTDKGSWSNYDPYVDYTTVRNCTIGPNVGAEAFDIKEGSTETIVEGCTIDGDGISGNNFADSFIDLKGTRSYIRCNTFYRSGESNITKGIACIDRGVALSSYEHSIHDNTFYMDQSSNNMAEAYSGTADVYAWNNTRVPSGDDYSSRITTSCCPSWYSNPPACGSGGGGGGGTTCDAPTGLSTSGVTQTDATFSWSAASGANDYDLRYRETGSSTWTNASNLSGTSYSTTSLTAGTTYEWEVRTSCSSSNSSYASGSNFTTQSSGGGGGGGGGTAGFVLYDDAVDGDWNDYSYSGTYNASNTSNVQVGSNSYKASYNGYGGVNLKTNNDLDVSGFTALRFWVKSDGSHLIRVTLATDSGNEDYEFNTSASWQQLTINMSEFGNPNTVDNVKLVNRSSSSFDVYYDQIEFLSSSSRIASGIQAGQVNAWPNPAIGGTFNAELSHPEYSGPLSVALYDLTGRVVWSQETVLEAGEPLTLKVRPTQDLPQGVYVLMGKGTAVSMQTRVLIR
ncbi:fibronectin type III domain-containing protein [Pontibacter sp. G13]|uniref:fibronectin type III domain-containing protein n=1 Tax=Pontibacter sp. G13 TaxID=3074898 RepID=UPI00288A8DF6|nr:fibronectin type III domain-containing protein [Pontibacter sp. G13]WNJ18183.1 fibronectin type III domain-containing protein [Pontibacter sp. G13]